MLMFSVSHSVLSPIIGLARSLGFAGLALSGQAEGTCNGSLGESPHILSPCAPFAYTLHRRGENCMRGRNSIHGSTRHRSVPKSLVTPSSLLDHLDGQDLAAPGLVRGWWGMDLEADMAGGAA